MLIESNSYDEQPEIEEVLPAGNVEEVEDQEQEIEEELSEESLDESKQPDEQPDVDTDYELYKETKPFMDKIRADATLKEYLGYQSEGYSAERIIEGMFLKNNPEAHQVLQAYYSGKLKPVDANVQSQEVSDEPPEFDTMQEEIQWHTQKAIKEALAPIMQQINPQLQTVAQKQQMYEQQLVMEQVRVNNDTVLEDALYQNGYEVSNVTDKELKAIASTLQSLYPGANFRTAMLTPQQADLVVSAALGRKTRKADTSTLSKQAQLPRINPVGNSSRRDVKPSIRTIDGVSKAERAERYKAIF